jgi:hypothetical protein
MSTDATYVIENGTVVGLAGGPLSLADMGERRTRRASHLIFEPSTNLWLVRDAASDEIIYSNADYDVALQWEATHYNRLLAGEI